MLNLLISPMTADEVGVYEVSRAEGAEINITPASEGIRNVAKVKWQDLVGNEQLTRDPIGPTQINADLPYEQHSTVDLPGAFPTASQVPVTLAANHRAFIRQPVYGGTIETTWVKQRWDGKLIPAAYVPPGAAMFVPEDVVDREGGEGNPGLYYVHGITGTEPTIRFQVGPRGDDMERQMNLIERARLRDPKEYL